MNENNGNASRKSKSPMFVAWLVALLCILAYVMFFCGKLVDAIFPWFRTTQITDDLVTIFGLGVYFLSTIYLILFALVPKFRPPVHEKTLIIPVIIVGVFQIFISFFLIKLLTTAI
jgi:hypothetical protein